MMTDQKRVVDGIKYIPHDAEFGDYFGASFVFPNNETLFVSSPYHQSTGNAIILLYLNILILYPHPLLYSFSFDRIGIKTSYRFIPFYKKQIYLR